MSIFFSSHKELKPDICSFASDEHNIVGNRSTNLDALTLPNGANLTFGEIVALGGDFYGVPEQPIVYSLEQNALVDSNDRRERFLLAYYTLGNVPYTGEVKRQLDLLVRMLNEITAGTHHYSNQEWDEATGGTWLRGFPLVYGMMLRLAKNNYDHFMPYAKDAYVTGHELAIEKSRQAANESDEDTKNMMFSEAYSLDAFACHFLTDCFSSGHIRTPRVQLPNSVTPAVTGDLLSKFMHDEDCQFGIRVKNRRGDKWISYGDEYLLEDRSKDNLRYVIEAVRKSADQVKKAFCHPDAQLNSTLVTDLIPFVDQEENNNSPLFQENDAGQLVRRNDITDLQDTETKSNWWGSTTANLLLRYRPENSAI